MNPHSDDMLVSLIIPVYNRREELHACLSSVVRQSYRNFEAIVVDDCSTMMIEDIVEQFGDPRLKYLRNPKNGGPYNARTVGWQAARGDYIICLDSDWEAFPWLLERVVRYFGETPEADAVTGMFLRSEDSRVFVRVKNGTRLVTPDQVASLPPVSDCIAGVRRCVIDEWLAKSHDYFALEAHSWLTFSHHRSQLYVDEPWALYHVDAPNRVTQALSGKNTRQIDDCLLFLKDHDQLLRTSTRGDLDKILIWMLSVMLKNTHREGLLACAGYLRIRKRNVAMLVAGLMLSKVFRKVAACLGFRRRSCETVWI
jgi:hypothetical protein